VLPQPEAVAACVEVQTLDLLDADVIPKSATQVSRQVNKALKQIDAERALRSAIYRQVERLERLSEQEEKLPFLIPNGHKEIAAMGKLAESLHEIELGKEWLRGKGGNMPLAWDGWWKDAWRFERLHRRTGAATEEDHCEFQAGRLSSR
jgi:hypothetical protein